jgi:CheY-like chemotaxis protein
MVDEYSRDHRKLLKKAPAKEGHPGYPSGKERRSVERFLFQGHLDAIYGSRLIRLRLENISERGFCFRSEAPMDERSRLMIKLDCYPVDVALEASVIWCKGIDERRYLLGTRFINLPKEEALLLKGFIAGLRHSREDSLAPWPDSAAPPRAHKERLQDVVRILLIEDMRDHAYLITRMVHAGSLNAVWCLVADLDDLAEALVLDLWDIVLSDLYLPDFTGLDALEVVKRLAPRAPFIIVTSSAEDIAMSAARRGAVDYVLKDELEKLPPLVNKELRKSRRASRRAESGGQRVKSKR